MSLTSRGLGGEEASCTTALPLLDAVDESLRDAAALIKQNFSTKCRTRTGSSGVVIAKDGHDSKSTEIRLRKFRNRLWKVELFGTVWNRMESSRVIRSCLELSRIIRSRPESE